MGRLLVLSSTFGALACIILAFALHVDLRALLAPYRKIPVRSPLSTTVTNTTQARANSTQLIAACQAACSLNTCLLQSPITAVVANCTACGSGRVLYSGKCQDPSGCTAWPWCSTSEATIVINVHNALLKAKLEFSGNTTVPYTGTITSSSLWASVLQPKLTSTEAVTYLNLFLAAKASGDTGALSATSYFNDETGWWRNSLTSYQAALPLAYSTYVTTLKRKLCTKTWQTGSVAYCLVPS